MHRRFHIISARRASSHNAFEQLIQTSVVRRKDSRGDIARMNMKATMHRRTPNGRLVRGTVDRP